MRLKKETLEKWAEYFSALSKDGRDFFAGRAETYKQLAILEHMGVELPRETPKLEKKGGAK